MSLTPLQKSQKLIEEASLPLIFIPPYPSIDLLASAFALYFFFEGQNSKPKIICDSADDLRETLSFISPSPASFESTLSGARDFVVIFNTKYNPISEVRTEKSEGELRVYITPEKASIDPRDFSFQPTTFSHDLVITLGAPDKESLGQCYEKNPDVFYEVPIINIDSGSSNELYGQVNMVDITASTVSEIVSTLLNIEKTNDEVSLSVYEYLLAGIISGTQSFQKPDTRPQAFRLASLLMEKGADQQKIIKALYKTQPLHLLKLWGKTLANIKWNEKKAIIWGLVSLSDLVHARGSVNDLPLVLEKIKQSYTDAKIYMLIYQESPTITHALLCGSTNEITHTLGRVLSNAVKEGDILRLRLEKDSLEATEEEILSLLENN